MPDINPVRPGPGGNQVLHRPLDVQGHAELVRNASGESTNETYQGMNGEHLWTIKRFPGASSDHNNPEEVEQ
ncbi:hypothetical protein NEK97_16565 [Paenarthrobacter sp. UW852]|uniref:hypothetical protein n=1 Tax=Paenarthrobacter sp. UW852 TaxID=2951989 RepID=UPI00214899C0|nr:hypothetical protein [Paenarthrobacter sp. UW852]MCR1163078.1 hypothetical protein [Paenarthrobacter sp. UW852]